MEHTLFPFRTIQSLSVRSPSSPDVICNQKTSQAHTPGKVGILAALETQCTAQLPEAFLCCEMAYGCCLKQDWMVSM